MIFKHKVRQKLSYNVMVLCLVVPNHKLLSAQLSKTLVNRCFFYKVCNYFKNISKKVCIYKNKSYIYIIIINK